MDPLSSGSVASSNSFNSRFGHFRPKALSAGPREVEGRSCLSGSWGEYDGLGVVVDAKRANASRMSRSVEAEMLFWRASGDGLVVGRVVGGGGRLEGRDRVGGYGVSIETATTHWRYTYGLPLL